MFAFFSVQGGVLPPPPPHRHSGAYFAHPDFRLTIMHSVLSPTADASDTASPEDWLCLAFIANNRPTAYSGQAAKSPVRNLSANPNAATFSRSDEAMNRNRNSVKPAHPSGSGGYSSKQASRKSLR
jgi:hypothetical protein